jgi:protein-S-isoprenylcysteine O-methyltransferase Ste14
MTSPESTPTPDASQRRSFFVRRRTVFTWLVPLLLLSATVIFHRNDGGLPAFAAGIALVVLGEIVRFWAAGYISKDAVITMGGPYGFVRNPLYFGSLLLAVGYGLTSGLGIAGVVVMILLFLPFHMAAILDEEAFLKTKFGEPYLAYLAKVPRLIPSLWPKTKGEGSYSWSKAIENREHISAAFAVVFVILLTLCRHSNLVH